MRIGVFADIHGNRYSFEGIIKALKEEACERYFFAGDVCGYYYHQNEIIDALRGDKTISCVLGNHDALFLRMRQDKRLLEDYSAQYGNSCRFLLDTITGDNLAFLQALPRHILMPEAGLGVFHGSPWDELNEYIYPADDLARFRKLSYKFVVLGHTHYAMDRMAGSVRVVNPGSSGQPRDGKEPGYAVIDTQKNTVELKEVPYDHACLARDIKERAETNPYLWEILERKAVR